MAKAKLKIEARLRRKKGQSVKVIARDLQVSTSSVSLWCRDVKLTKRQIETLQKNARDPYYGRRLTYALKQQAGRKLKDMEIRNEAIRTVGKLSGRDVFVAGIALYWAEGFKKDKMVGFSNSDPEMIRFALDWLNNVMEVKREHIKLRVVVNESHKYRIDDIQNYWVGITGLTNECFYKPTFQKVKWVKIYEKPEEYFGILRIRVLKSTCLLKKIKGLIEGLKQNV